VIGILLLCLIVDMLFGGHLGLTGAVFGLFMQLFQMGLQVFMQLVYALPTSRWSRSTMGL
jgi:hypothetical protein